MQSEQQGNCWDIFIQENAIVWYPEQDVCLGKRSAMLLKKFITAEQ